MAERLAAKMKRGFRGFRWVPAIAGGFLASLILYFLISMLAGSPQVWSLPLGWALVGWWVGKGQRHAWGRVWLVLALESFALPLVSLIFGAHITSDAYSTVTAAASSKELDELNRQAIQGGAVLGGAVSYAMLAGCSAFVGFFLGIIFAILAYFGHRGPMTTEPPAETQQ